MVRFAVWHEGVPENTGRWVLGIDAPMSRFLLSNDEGGFYWQAMADCRLVRAATPDNPQLVLPVQTQQQGGIVLPNLKNGHR